MAFSNPIVGGDNTLIRDRIQSEGFVTNVSGWRIEKDGDAEFNELVARGSIRVTGTGNQEIEIVAESGQPHIVFTDSAGERWVVETVQNGSFSQLTFAMETGGGTGPDIIMTEAFGIAFRADDGGLTAVIVDPVDRFLKYGLTPFQPHNWNTLTLNAVGGVTTATFPCEYKLFPDGMVRCRGQLDTVTTPIPSGTVLFTLPAGFRPVNEARLPAVFNGSAVHGKFTIRTNGNVEIADAPNDKPALDSIVFSVI